MNWHTVYIALGSNRGDRKEFLVRAVDLLLHTPGFRLQDLSNIIETPPIDMADENAGDFLNAVLSAQVTLDPDTLLERLRDIERLLGRDRNNSNEGGGGDVVPENKHDSRTIDLDLLLYDDLILDTPELVIPHPRMHERAFVLDPLLEIAPDLVHPKLKTSFQALRDDL